jgi:hypothetical protein
VLALDGALEKLQRENPNGVSGAPTRDAVSDRADSPPAAGLPAQGGPTSLNVAFMKRGLVEVLAGHQWGEHGSRLCMFEYAR